MNIGWTGKPGFGGGTGGGLFGAVLRAPLVHGDAFFAPEQPLKPLEAGEA